MMLREIKDFKKEFRDPVPELKVYKQDHNDAQQQIDVLKEKLLIVFETLGWYVFRVCVRVENMRAVFYAIKFKL